MPSAVLFENSLEPELVTRAIVDMELGTRGRLIVTTFNLISGNQGKAQLFEYNQGQFWHRKQLLCPKKMSWMCTRLVGRATIVGINRSTFITTWQFSQPSDVI